MKRAVPSRLRLLSPSVAGLLLLVACAAIVAGLSAQASATIYPPEEYQLTQRIGWPTWYQSTSDGVTTRAQVRWLNIFVFVALVWVGAMPLGRVITEASRPLRAGWIYAGVTAGICVAAVLAGASVSRWYWGYWFSRPAVDWRIAGAASVQAITPIDNLDPAGTGMYPGTLPEFTVRSGGDWSNTSQLSGSRERGGYYTLQGRILNALEDAGHDLNAAPPRADEELIGLHALLVATGWLDGGSGVYTARADHLTGYAIDLTDPRGNPLLLLTISSGPVANDHFAYYEMLFGPPATPGDETSRPLIGATRFYYDVAGLEGMEWYGISILLGVLGLLVALPLTAAASVVIGSQRRNRLAWRGFPVGMSGHDGTGESGAGEVSSAGRD